MSKSLVLAALAAASAPMTVKEIAAEIGKSDSRTRELIKADQAEIQCKKNDAGQNVFWIDGPAPTADKEDLVGADPIEACPFCQATEDQVPAGPEGSFLGASRTCGTCGKTYNVFSGEEVNNMAGKTTKRKPLNPQYKINAKTEAVEAAGGKLKYEKDGRTWVLTKKGKEARRMTAVEFSNETPETLVAAIS